MNEFLERGIIALESIVKSIENSNQIESLLVIFTVITAISSIVFGILSFKKSEKQIEESWRRQDAEHFERVRPWLVIKTPMPFQVEYEYNTEPYEKFTDRPLNEQEKAKAISLAFRYSNQGQRVAKDLKRIAHYSLQSFTKDEFEKIEEITLNMSLAPEQEQSYQLYVPYENWLQLKDKPVYLGLQISYDNGKYRSTSGGLYKFSNIGPIIIATWYT